MVVAGRWGGVLAADWAIWSREGKRRSMESPSVARRMPDLRAPEMVELATKNSKARLTIVRRFRQSWRVAPPPSSLVANSTAMRPSSSLPPPTIALSQTSSSRSNKIRSIGITDSRKPSSWRIVLGKNCTTPLSSVTVTTSRVLSLSWKGSSVAPVRLTCEAAVKTMVA